VGVFWALLFLCHQGKLELEQEGGLFGPLTLRCLTSPETNGHQHGLPQLLPTARAAASPAAQELAA
jgi:segregation and condensation protein A